MADLLVRGIAREAGLRILAAVSTDLSREAASRHGAVGIAACALGRALTSSVLIATLTKGSERVTVQIQGDGPIGGAVVDAQVDLKDVSTVRGYLTHPKAIARGCDGRCNTVEVLGRVGVVNVMRDLGLKERYQGQTALLTGEIDEDVEGYLRSSEQIPSALGCDGVLDGLELVAAGGVLVQALPGADADSVRPSQHALRTGAVFNYLSASLRARADGSGIDARALAEAVYGAAGGGTIEWLGEQALVYRCRCSAERVESMLTLLTTVDLDEMIADDKPSEVTCNFCNTTYVVERPALERIRAAIAHGPRENN